MRLLRFLFLLTLCACGSPGSSGHKVTVAVASNMQFAMSDIAQAFTKEHDVPVQISSGSSGTLTTQIKQGAPFDVFVSANMRYPTALYNEKLTAGLPKTYAFGTLVLWSMDDIDLSGGLESLLDEEVHSFAIANPEIAPYGIAAFEALDNSKLKSQLEKKYIIGESVGQVNQYIKSGAVQAGLTSGSVLFTSNLQSKGNSVVIDRGLYTPIKQGIVILKNGAEENFHNANLFYDFMFSDQVKVILNKYGYQTDGIQE